MEWGISANIFISTQKLPEAPEIVAPTADYPAFDNHVESCNMTMNW
jgi:hypothetical protein